AAGAKWKCIYDEEGRLISRINPLGQTTQYVFEGTRPVQVIDAAGRVTGISYDDSGLVAALRYADGSTRSWVYDALGRQTHSIDQRGLTRRRFFDYAGNTIRIDEPDGSSRTF